MLRIKKYSNRRLYDTEASRYITSEELSDRIRAGRDVQVVDAKTGEDLTQATLVQVIIEGRGAGRMLPVPLLHQMIRLGDEALGEFMGRWMAMALDLYLQARSGAQSLAPLNPLATLPFGATNALARLLGGAMPFLGGGWGPAPTPAPEPAAPPRPAPAPPAANPVDEMAMLRRDMDALRSELERQKGRKRAAKG